MAVSIDQKPLYEVLPIGQKIIFAVSDNVIYSTKFKVKYIAQVYVSDSSILFNSSELIGTFKTTPNNVGVGIFDLRPILETFVTPDHEAYEAGGSGTQYKGIPANIIPFPVHIVDKYSLNTNTLNSCIKALLRSAKLSKTNPFSSIKFLNCGNKALTVLLKDI